MSQKANPGLYGNVYKKSIVGIAALTPEGYIGYDNNLIWRFKEDLQMFRAITSGGTVIMGSKTFKSMMSIPLGGRVNIVVTSKGLEELEVEESISPDSPLLIARNPAEAINIAEAMNRPIFVIGGAKIWEEVEDFITAWIIFNITEPTPKEILRDPSRAVRFLIPAPRIKNSFMSLPGPKIFNAEYGESPRCVGEYTYFIRKALV